VCHFTDQKETIGWFKYRKNSPTRPSLRDLVVHKSLQTKFSQPLIFGLLTQIQTSRICFELRFFTLSENVWKPMDHSIRNILSSSIFEYQDFTPLSPPALSSNLGNLTQIYTSHVNLFEKVFSGALENVRELSEKVRISNEEIKKLNAQLGK
jgi:hypothetical protein